MPAATLAPPPELRKPKSKLRLRLGLTPPRPKVAQPKATAQNVTTTTSKQATSARIVSAKQPLEPLSAASQNIITPSSSTLDLSKLTIRSTDASPLTITSLDSTSLRTSLQSRTDSRSAFTYDNHSSINSNTGHTATATTAGFDTVSYASASPSSISFARHASTSSEVDGSPASGHPTPFKGNWKSKWESLNEFSAHYPNIAAAVAVSDDIFYITDQQLSDRFRFKEEIGFGNWGCVWRCRPRHARASVMAGGVYGEKEALFIRKMGKAAYASGGSGSGGTVALKLVHRERSPTTAARVKALWGEMKIIRSLRQEPHPSIINFEAFIITPSYAVVIMPCLRVLIPVGLPAHIATPYFRQLASAVGYLHERGITHNDIKPANVLLSHNDIPVLVDFGFAQQFDVHEKGSFLSTSMWGTPEYLDPQRARGLPHDERASDVWALGVTMYEILIGRTPFERTGTEDFETPEQIMEYYERTREGTWLGEWEMPGVYEHLLRHMISPDPVYRMSAMDAYRHPALQPKAPEVIITPHFIREATAWDHYEYDPEPIPFLPPVPIASQPVVDESTRGVDGEKKKRKKKKDATHTRAATPTALGESIKQHTSMPRVRAQKGDGVENEPPSPTRKKGSRLMLKPLGGDGETKGDEEDPTPTKVLKPAQPLRIKELSHIVEKKTTPRTSQSKTATISRPSSNSSMNGQVNREYAITSSPNVKLTSAQAKTLAIKQSFRNLRSVPSAIKLTSRDSTTTAAARTDSTSASAGHRESIMSFASTGSAPKTKEEAVLKTMKSLEGDALKSKRDVLSKITRPAPVPPKPASSESVERMSAREEQRRSLGIVQTLEKVEESDSTESTADANMPEDSDRTSMVNDIPSAAYMGSPPKKRMAAPPVDASGSPARTASIPFPAFKSLSPASAKNGGGHIRTLSAAQAEAEISGDGLFDSMPSPPTAPQDFGVASISEAEEKGPKPAISMINLRKRIVSADQEQVLAFRKSTENVLEEPQPTARSPITAEDPALAHRKSIEALAIDSRLDKISEWVKTVEKIVEDARRALAEGRDPPPLPSLLPPPDAISPELAPILAASLSSLAPSLIAPSADPTAPQPADAPLPAHSRQFGVTPDRLSSLPAHLRTSSVQVEPATPPKWITYAEAEAQIKAANASWENEGGARRSKKERPSVGHVLKLFGDKEKKEFRSSTPEPNSLIPLKPPAHALRATPSTPALRNSTSTTRRMPFRKSESNLRNYNTMPTLVSLADVIRADGANGDQIIDEMIDDTDDLSPAASPTSASPRRGLYERFLDSTPGVVRSGEGWGSLSSGRAMAKPSSVLSLREKARAWMGGAGDRQSGAETLATDGGRRGSKQTYLSSTGGRESGISLARPGTPGAASVLTMGTTTGTITGAGSQGKKSGLWKGWKGLGRKKE